MNIGDKWNGWTVESMIGSGSFGSVYRIVREEFGYTYESALKVIRIPQNPSDITPLKYSGMDEEDITEYFKNIVQSIIYEFTIMSQMRGHSNIVSYEDHSVRELENDFGWEICIRMELLTPLYTYIKDHSMSGDDVVRLGIDMCHALEMCEKQNIVHRDIKPGNIFVSRQGTFKLGDFGVARQMEKTTSGMSKKGTYSYMAPEVYMEQPYDSTVDIYSLGLVLYRFMNDNRAPFFPPYPQKIRYEDTEKANRRRLRGDALPPPANASDEFAEVILKACSFDPADRYRTAREMREALEAVTCAFSDEKKNSAADQPFAAAIEPSASSAYRPAPAPSEPSAPAFVSYAAENTDNTDEDETVGMPVGTIQADQVQAKVPETVPEAPAAVAATPEPAFVSYAAEDNTDNTDDEETVGMPIGNLQPEPAQANAPKTVPETPAAADRNKGKKKIPVAAIVMAVLVLLCVIVSLIGGGKTDKTPDTAAETTTEEAATEEDITAYDDLESLDDITIGEMEEFALRMNKAVAEGDIDTIISNIDPACMEYLSAKGVTESDLRAAFEESYENYRKETAEECGEDNATEYTVDYSKGVVVDDSNKDAVKADFMDWDWAAGFNYADFIDSEDYESDLTGYDAYGEVDVICSVTGSKSNKEVNNYWKFVRKDDTWYLEKPNDMSLPSSGD